VYVVAVLAGDISTFAIEEEPEASLPPLPMMNTMLKSSSVFIPFYRFSLLSPPENVSRNVAHVVYSFRARARVRPFFFDRPNLSLD